jgi:cell division protein FtsQ
VVVAALAALLGAVSGEALFAAGSEPRAVSVIAVRGDERLSAADVAEATGVAPGAPLEGVDAGAVSERLERHDWIARAAVLQMPGGALLVSVRERRPVATVSVDGKLYAVDERGAPFAPLDEEPDPGLLRLVAQQDISPREPSAALAQALRLAERLPELGMAAPAEVSIASQGDPEGYGLRLPALPARVVLGRADLDARLEDLARLLAARPDAVAEATSIDLRFANQVVLRSTSTREGSANTAEGRGGAPPRNQRPTG